jgi:hypothetical protein
MCLYENKLKLINCISSSFQQNYALSIIIFIYKGESINKVNLYISQTYISVMYS